MVRFVVREVVVTYFPYTDLSKMKKRPALILAPAGAIDLVVCEITSQPPSDQFGIYIDEQSFEKQPHRDPQPQSHPL